MSLFNRLLLIPLIILCACSILHANDDMIIIRKIEIKGLKHTKNFVVKRELNFSVGDTLWFSEIQDQFQKNEDNLIRSGLFFYARLNIKNWRLPDPKADIVVDLKESWYFIPVPVVKLADRNFNVWIKDYDASLDRLIFGIRAYHTNLSGRNDYLKLVAQFGYSQHYNILYRFPYLNKKNTLGVNMSLGYSLSRNSVYNTFQDKQLYLDANSGHNFKTFHVSTGVKYRRKIDVTHNFSIGYYRNEVTDTILRLNPQYFSHSQTEQAYFSVSYAFLYDRRNHKKQPTDGFAIHFSAAKVGLGVFNDVDYGFLEFGIHNYLPIFKKFTWRIKPKARLFFNEKNIPYNHAAGLGHRDDLVRGYEHYVVDGTDFFLAKTGIMWEFFKKTYNFSKVVPLKKFEAIPLRLFLTMNLDVAYVKKPRYENQNVLDERWINGYGPALEMILMEAMVFKIEYSINHLGESGVFLHTQFSL